MIRRSSWARRPRLLPAVLLASMLVGAGAHGQQAAPAPAAAGLASPNTVASALPPSLRARAIAILAEADEDRREGERPVPLLARRPRGLLGVPGELQADHLPSARP